MEKKVLTLNVNDQDYELYINPKALLIEAIRDYIGLTGPKRGCDTVSCGACTVIVDDMAVKACSVLAMQCEGKKIITPEGLEVNGKLHAIQKAFLDEGAFQCGFCTSGMLMSATAFINETKGPVEEMEIRESIEGNICRCTGYNSIVRAIDAVLKGKYAEDRS
jgi:aerobic-type carbon monoxide dehydrogenase small subunit (CoxS/CutS family)